MGETYDLALYKREKNSAFETKAVPDLLFKGRPARPMEKSIYSLRNGVTTGTDEVYVYCSNLPAQVSVGDRVFYMGKYWQVTSVGVYFENTRVVNASIMSPQVLMDNAPKGITLR